MPGTRNNNYFAPNQNNKRQNTIKSRMILIIISVSIVSILLTSLGIVAYSYYNMQNELSEDIKQNAKIIGDRNAAFLDYAEFVDKDDIINNLKNALEGKSSISKVCLYDKYEGLVANFIRKTATDNKCPTLGKYPKTISENNFLNYEKEVKYESELVGYIYIQSDLKKIRDYLYKIATTALLVTLLAVILSFILASYLQRFISVPLNRLINVAEHVTREKDYSIRASAEGAGKSEISKLFFAFNNMLNEIETRDDELSTKNQEYLNAKHLAEAANESKTQFLANISHELRTPLNVIIGFSDIIRNELMGKLNNDTYMEYADDINNSGKHLLDIINDILDTAKAESGKLEIRLGKVDVADALKDCIRIVRNRLEDSKLNLKADFDKDIRFISADKIRFKQIILNIISNAIKFTPQNGVIKVRCRRHLGKDHRPEVLIEIEDSGIGMKKSDVERAFESFIQIDAGLNRLHEGTGLGLPLTRQLVRLHGGDIYMDSIKGRGTLVSITLPEYSNDIEDIEIDYPKAA